MRDDKWGIRSFKPIEIKHNIRQCVEKVLKDFR